VGLNLGLLCYQTGAKPLSHHSLLGRGGQDLPFFIVLFFCGWQYLCILAGAYERTKKLADELQALGCGDFNAQGMYASLLPPG
jgi:hypothetical protein